MMDAPFSVSTFGWPTPYLGRHTLSNLTPCSPNASLHIP
jgi:hypothetical protein